jgi:hypothetical protein
MDVSLLAHPYPRYSGARRQFAGEGDIAWFISHIDDATILVSILVLILVLILAPLQGF